MGWKEGTAKLPHSLYRNLKGLRRQVGLDSGQVVEGLRQERCGLLPQEYFQLTERILGEVERPSCL